MALLRWAAAAAVLATGLRAASLQQITTDFGPNPRGVGFYVYVPETLVAAPPVVVMGHWCQGSAAAAFAGTQWASLADRHGFVVIYPDSPNTAEGKCWDLSSAAGLRHDGGGDSLGVASMVRWALTEYGGDADRVFATGVSSGAMLTQSLLGAYPDLFAAGAAFAGVPFACFAAGTAGGFAEWSDDCAKGRVVRSGPAWADLVRAAYPAYEGWRPKVQLFHGTEDEVLNYTNHREAVKQWASVLGLPATPTTSTPDTPMPGWTKDSYGPHGWLEAYSAAGVSHNIPNQEAVVMDFFDLACTGPNCFRRGQGSPL